MRSGREEKLWGCFYIETVLYKCINVSGYLEAPKQSGGGGVQEANICEPQAPPPVGPKQAQGAFQTSFGSFKRSTDHIEGFPSKGLWSRR